MEVMGVNGYARNRENRLRQQRENRPAHVATTGALLFTWVKYRQKRTVKAPRTLQFKTFCRLTKLLLMSILVILHLFQ